MNLSLETLKAAVAGRAAALRCRRKLQPAGGKGDKVFPPTYEGGTYAFEERVIDGQRVPCVLLDSVQSQANRMELALLQATRDRKISVPLVEVDFKKGGIKEVGIITSLEAPHRLADAILRDSTLNGQPFRKTAEGKTLDGAKVVNSTGLFAVCPTALVFGLWDSTGSMGGMGTKFQRALVSEIAGIDVKDGVRPSSRIDPLGIQLNAGPLYATADGGWTLKSEEAKKDKGKAVLLGKDGKPSEANLGNITPTFKGNHGGVTMDHALQTAVISLPALRRLKFPVDKLARDQAAADIAARTALAALGLCGAVLSIEDGCDLRSRCQLVPEPGQGGWELVNGNGTSEPFALDAEAACALLQAAVASAKYAGLPWRDDPLRLVPSPGLVALVQKSHKLATQAGAKSEG
ncbi:MAG: type I-U CRISPR-associated protein Cas7 [Lentisphaerae bacterium]|nr:type I-U CRISPR-associated protein Cas7 [Lentisphaerota bacterium]